MKRLLIAVFLFSIIIFGFLSCQKELSQESNINNATFSLINDSTLACLSTPVANGDYYNGVAARDVNFLTVVVNVKTTGNYSISSIDTNGFHFADSGFFSRIGIDTLILKMKGRPILTGVFDFSFGDTTCPFSVDVQDSTGTGLGGVDTSGSGASGGYSATYVDDNPAGDDKWHFTDSTNNKTYSGNMSGAAFASPTLAGSGVSSSNSAVIFNFGITTADITTGSYPLDGTNTIALTDATDQTAPVVEYTAVGNAAEEATDPSSINITSYDGSRLKISFRCWATDASGNSALIKGSLNTKKL